MQENEFVSSQKRKLAQSQQRCILSIDCSTQLASVCLMIQGNIIFKEECFRQKSHSEWIHGSVDRALSIINHNWDTLDLIAVSNGPGSFTGVRVATNLAKSLAFTKQIPIVSFCSLEILAHQVGIDSKEDFFILPMINAFKNMVFWSLYQIENQNLKCILEPQAITITELEGYLSQISISQKTNRFQLIGDGYSVYKYYLDSCSKLQWVRDCEPKDYPLAETMAFLTNKNWDQLEPLHWRSLIPNYIRASAAEEAKALKYSTDVSSS